jgi:hypothetical protein
MVKIIINNMFRHFGKHRPEKVPDPFINRIGYSMTV